MQLGYTNEHCGIKLSAHVSEENGYEIENKNWKRIYQWMYFSQKEAFFVI